MLKKLTLLMKPLAIRLGCQPKNSWPGTGKTATKSLVIMVAALAWLFAGSAVAGTCSGTYSVSYSPNPISTTIGNSVNIIVTASPAAISGVNQTYDIQLNRVNSGTFQGVFNPGNSSQSSKITTAAGSPSATFSYVPPASFATYPGNSGDFQIKVTNRQLDCDIKPSGAWPVSSVTVTATCATPISMTTLPAMSVNAGSTLSFVPSVSYGGLYNPVASGGGGALTYSSAILTQDTNAGSLTFNSSTGAFDYTPGAGFTGNYIFTLKADRGTCHAQQDVTVNVQNPTVCTAPSMPSFSFSTLQDTAFSGAPSTTGGTTPYTYTLSTAPAHGAVILNATTGSYTYTPTTGYSGADSFALGVASNCTDTSVTPNIVNPGTTATASVTIGATPIPVCNAPTLGAFSFIVPSGSTSASFTPAVSGGTTPYLFSLPTTTTTHGTVALTNSSTGQITYTPTVGYTGNDSFQLNVASSCGGHPGTSATGSVTVSSNAVAGTYGTTTGNIAVSGAIIIDNTPNPGTPGIVTNMNTNVGGKNFGAGNAFNIDGIQVMQRDITASPHNLVDEAGVTNTASTSYQNYGTAKQTTYFANGQHLFDLDRMRRAANWMRVPSGAIGATAAATIPDATTGNAANLMTAAIPANYLNSGANLPTNPASCTGQGLRTPGMGTPIGTPVGSCHPAGTYGVITWREFLGNIANARTMYGVVRVLVPLQLGKAASTNNALNVTVGTANIYGFCAAGAGEWCADSPTGSTDIKGGAAVAGNNTGTAISIPAITTTAGQLRVRGVLMFDFVNGTTDAVYGAPGHPIGLDHLPFQPRDIYFKVSVPINVNAGNDTNGDGQLDNLAYISGLTSVITCSKYPCSTVIPNSTVIDNTKVPQEAVDAYNFQYGTTYTGNTDPAFVTKYNSLNKPNQYHLLNASGYVDGWYDAFHELNITAQKWSDLGFAVPPGANLTQPLNIGDIRSASFEDLPVYLYTGGLVDMHHHMNVSGLIYVPQAAEIEQKFNTIRMYMNGGLVVRDGFFLEGQAGGITLISSDPQSFASIKVNSQAIVGSVLTAAFSTLHSGNYATASPLGVGMGGGSGGGTVGGSGDNSIAGGGGAASVGRTQWIEIRPR